MSKYDDLQMASMIKDAKFILKEQKWRGKSYVFIFIGESTIHICYVHSNGTTTTQNKHINTNQMEDFFTRLYTIVEMFSDFTSDRQIRVVLAGLPSRISTESSAGTFEFFNSADMKVDTISTKKRLQELATFAGKLEKDGGLKKSDGSNPGKDALDCILRAMPDDENWVIACGIDSEEPAHKKTRLAAPFTYVGREFTDRCVYALS